MATILVVDDDSAVLRLVVTVLERAGHKVMSGSNGLEALQIYQSYARELDLVLTDVKMPEMSGLELAARIRATHPSARVLLMTAVLPAGAEQAPRFYPLLHKPFGLADLLAAVERVFQQPVR